MCSATHSPPHCRVDRSLDELEHHPLPLQQRIYEISRGPAAEATGRGLQAAAEVTLKVGVYMREATWGRDG